MILTVEYLGLCAGMLTTVSFLPQVIKIWKTHDVGSISLAMYAFFCTGLLLWITYGIALNSLSLILFNSITFFLAFFVLSLKILIERRKRHKF